MSEEHAPVGRWPRELSLDHQLGPAPYLTRGKADALIFAALDEAGFASETPASEALEAATPDLPKVASRSPWRPTRYVAAAVALLACVGVGSASAAVLWYVREQRVEQAAPTPRVTQLQSEHKPRPTKTVVAPADTRAELPEITIEVDRDRPERRAPEDYLVEGNRQRAARRWAKADEAYTRAFQVAPRSQAAYVARVASAAVRLEHLDDPTGALAGYRAALRQMPQGQLGEEILFGIAEAQRALGNRAAEREALVDFLARFPSSALAKQAQARLE